MTGMEISGLTAQALWALIPLLIHFGLVAALYVVLTWARLVVVKRGQASTADFARADGDPRLSARIQRNLANQFEAPVFAWIGLILLILVNAVGPADVAAAWLFLIGRLIHSGVQCTGDNVALRGQAFMINFIAVLWLMGHAAWVVLGF
jgi:hypothetical protein